MATQTCSVRPRLVVSPSQFDRIAAALHNNSDSVLSDLYTQLKIAADDWSSYNNGEGIEFCKIDQKNLLVPARALVNVAYLYAGLSQIELLLENTTEAERLAEIAISQAVAASNLSSWLWPAPSALLSLGEMSHGVAVIYDWCYSFLCASDMETIESALVNNGIREYQTQVDKSAYWWTANPRSNFTNVINSGIGIAAIALSDHNAGDAGELASTLDLVNDSLVLGMSMYAPDAGWPEGLTYWLYATRYTCYYLSTLVNVKPSDQTTMSLVSSPGFSETGLFSIHSSGPSNPKIVGGEVLTDMGEVFNFSDSGPSVGDRHLLFWLGEHYEQPVCSYYEREFFVKSLVSNLTNNKTGKYPNKVTYLVDAYTPMALNLPWYSDSGTESEYAGLPISQSYKGIGAAYYRSSWTDKDAFYVGLKGGNNSNTHAHLDMGNFVLNWGGVRWLIELGSGDYGTPDYFQDCCGGGRWEITNVSTRFHNIWRPILPEEDIGDSGSGLNQNPIAAAPITSFDAWTDGTKFKSVISLSNAYPLQGIVNATRSFSLEDDVLSVSDWISTDDDFKYAIAWSFMTKASIVIENDTTLTLSQSERKLKIEIDGPGVAWKGWQKVTDPRDASKVIGNRVQASTSKLSSGSSYTTRFKITLVS